ncbi:hypothetical protein [Streptomyces sp. NPDC014623]|uniref:hypothetical protein n=1 Tax=Streptomyces sp. NPDC014623 TaxID=3364875 RepID=UPI0036F6F73B
MGIIRNGAMGSVVAFAVMSGFVATPALADEAPTAASTEEPADVNTAPPQEPEEADLLEEPEPEPEVTVKPPFDTPDAEYSSPRNVYLPKTKGGTYHKGVGPTNSNYNGTSHVARSTFVSDVTGEVGVSVTAGLASSVSVMIAEIEGKYEVNLTAKLTAKLGNTIAVNTPAKKTTNAKYGVYRLKNTGTSYKIYSNCQTTTKKTITSYTPLKVGWYLWES